MQIDFMLILLEETEENTFTLAQRVVQPIASPLSLEPNSRRQPKALALHGRSVALPGKVGFATCRV